MPASIYTSLRSFPASGLRLLRESHAFCTILTLLRAGFVSSRTWLIGMMKQLSAKLLLLLISHACFAHLFLPLRCKLGDGLTRTRLLLSLNWRIVSLDNLQG